MITSVVSQQDKKFLFMVLFELFEGLGASMSMSAFLHADVTQVIKFMKFSVLACRDFVIITEHKPAEPYLKFHQCFVVRIVKTRHFTR